MQIFALVFLTGLNAFISEVENLEESGSETSAQKKRGEWNFDEKIKSH